MQADQRLDVVGSNLEAGKDLNLVAKEIALKSSQNTLSEQNILQSSSSGISMGITRSPLLAMKSAYNGAKGDVPETGSFMNSLSREFEGSNAAAGAAMTPAVLSMNHTNSSGNETYESSTAQATTLTALGNLNIIATEGSITSEGTQMSAEGNALLLAKENINLGVARSGESASAYNSSKGMLLDNRASANMPTDIVGVYNKKGTGNGSSDSVTPTQLSIGGNLAIETTQGDIGIIGSNIAANGDVTINAARNLTIQSAAENREGDNLSNNKAIGKVIISDTERFSGYHAEAHNDSGNDATQVSSNIASLGGNVNLSAGDAYTQNGSNVMAAKDVNIVAKSIDVDASYNTGVSQSNDKTLKIGAFARVGSPLAVLANNVEAAQKSDGRLQAMQSMEVASNVYQVASAVPGSGGSGALVYAEAGVGVTGSNASQTATYSTAQTGNITGGNNVTLTTTEGDIRIKGSSLTAGDTLTLDSVNDILLEAAKSTEHSDGKHSNYGVEVGVGASYGAQTGIYAYVGLQAGHGKSLFDGTAYENALLLGDMINLKAKNDITLKGAEVRGNTITADAGDGLIIQSLQDLEHGTESESGMNLKVQVSFGTAWEISDKKGSGGVNLAKANGDYQSVNSQSGLFAGDGGFQINVANNTNLIGGVISSSQNAIDNNKNSLTTGTLTTSDIENHSDYQAGAIALSGGSNFTKSNSYGAGAGYESGNSSSITKSAISEGTVTITDEAKQLSLTGQTADETIASLNRDMTNTNTPLEKLPDLKVLLSDQQKMANATLTVVQTGIQAAQDIQAGKNILGNATKIVAGNTINAIAFAGNIITGNMDVDNAIASFKDPYKMAEAIKTNPELAATLDAFTKGEFDNLPKTKEGLQALADATGLKVDVLLTTITTYQDAKGSTDKNLIAIDVNPENRADTLSTLGHETSHVRGGTSETLADMSGYATQLLSEVAIGSYEQSYLNAMQFEMGTGQDAQTQAANQVLLGSDNQTLLNALNNHQLEFYFRESDPRLNVFYGTNNDKWNGKFSSQFIQKTNKKLGDFTTLLKSDESELTMLSMEYYKLFGAELGVGKFELPNFKSNIDDKGVNIEGGLGYKTIDGRAGFSIEKLFGTDFSIKGGIKGSIGGIGADGKLNVNQNKIGASGQVDFGLGIGADIEVKHDK